MANSGSFAAVDLGATSGRVILGTLRDGRITLQETGRFDNTPQTIDGHLHWDFDLISSEIVKGLNAAIAAAGGRLDSLGIDTWGVDYGRLDSTERLIEHPFHYRDHRTEGVPEALAEKLGDEYLYSVAGLQVQPFNTIYQLVASSGDLAWNACERILLTPDLLVHHLTGVQQAEMTIASTTGLLDVSTRSWSTELAGRLSELYGLPLPRVLPPLVEPGTVVGETLPGVLDAVVPVVAVAAHDTQSAVVAGPAVGRDFAFVSSGTWSLVGLELPAPVVTPESQAADYSNELGVDGTVSYLKNIMGLWVLIECRRAWEAAGRRYSWDEIVEMAAAEEPLACVLDMNDQRLMPPGGMPERLVAMAEESGQKLPNEPGPIARCILDSLALAYRRTIREACDLSGRNVEAVHIVGGGSQNTLLCQLTAEATGLPVVAGPAEGTALGNLLVQARAVGAVSGGLDALREVVVASFELQHYEPGVLPIDGARWDEADAFLFG